MSNNTPEVYVPQNRPGVSAMMDNSQANIVSTISQADFDGQIAILNAISSSEDIGDHLDEEIRVSDIVAQEVSINVAGVDTPAIRTTLITPDGKAYSTVSDSVFKTIRNMLGMLGAPDTWPAERRNAGVPLTISQQKSRNGFNFYNVKIGSLATQEKKK